MQNDAKNKKSNKIIIFQVNLDRKNYYRERRKTFNKSQRLRENEKTKLRMRRMRNAYSITKKEEERKRNRRSKRFIRLKGKISNEFSEGMDIEQYNLDCFEKSISTYHCQSCHTKRIISMQKKVKCPTCNKIQKVEDLYPGQVPLELQNLSFVERQLISRIHPVVSLYKIKNSQFGYSGNVINFPQDVQEVANILPFSVNDLRNIITIRLDNSDGYKDFNVCRGKVREALQWLKNNNPLYKNIKISKQKLNELPENGNVYKSMNGYTKTNADGNVERMQSCFKEQILEAEHSFDEDEDEPLNDNNLYHSEDSDTEIPTIKYTDVPNIKTYTQKDQINSSLSGSVYLWPTIGTTPVNEFSSPGYISLAFPTLFPFGKGDYSMLQGNKIKLSTYVDYLMFFEDGRFAKDERFRYFIMNSMMRWNSLNLGNIFVKKNDLFNKMTVLHLQSYLKKHPNLANKIMFYANKIRSTRPYWNSRCNELLDMVIQKGNPTIFFSLSSADFHWPEVYKLLGYNVERLSMKRRSQIIAENPLYFDSYFVLKSRYFVEQCMKEKFDIKNFWYRYEYQHRGSIHLHGVAWLSNCPDTSNVDTDKKKQDIIEYFENIITCNNPDVNVRMSGVHPCQIKLSSVKDHFEDLATLVNTVQRHTVCKTTYCLRKKSPNSKEKCRFGFPKPMNSKTELVMDGTLVKDIIFERNDPLLNKYNSWMLETWRANIDVTPIVNTDSIIRYIAKYVSKSEVHSNCYLQMLKDISNNTDDKSANCNTAIRKLLLKTCSERDYSAQEVVHYLCGYGFYHCSTDFVVLNMNNLNWVNVTKSKNCRTIFDHYKSRPSFLNCYSLFQYVRNYRYSKGKLHRKENPNIVRIFPRLQLADFDDLSEVQIDQLFLFFIPWRDESDLTLDNNEKYDTVRRNFGLIKLSLNFKQLNLLEKLNDLHDIWESGDGEGQENLGIDSNTVEKVYSGEHDISKYNPNVGKKEQVIGKRKLDRHHDWSNWSIDETLSELEDIHKKIMSTTVPQPLFSNIQSTLSEEQKKIYDFVKREVGKVRNGELSEERIGIIQGGAGTGKSFLLKHIYNYLVKSFGSGSTYILGPTGMSAKNVNGSTIHSFLHFGRQATSVQPLTGEELVRFQELGKDIKFLLIDEYSMIGCRLMSGVEQRIRELKDSEVFFGGIHVFFFGDIKQLVPVGDVPIFQSLGAQCYNNVLVERGKLIVQDFHFAFILGHNYRSSNRSYSEFLRRLADGNCTRTDLLKVRNRIVSVLPVSELNDFHNAIQICSTNALVNDHNVKKLKDLNQPIATITAKNNCKTAFESSDLLADGLQNVLYLAEGSRVMLRRNMNVSRGLVNGATGLVHKILYRSDSKPPDLPVFILIEFDNVDIGDVGYDYVPLKPGLTSFYKNSVHCTRQQFYLTLSWAITIHRAQGLGLLKMILELSDVDFTLGLLYVAFSRVSDMNDLILLRTITFERLNSVKHSRYYVDRYNFLEWLKE